MKYVHHNKCEGGYAFEEIDHNTYCLGRVDAAFEVKVFADECKRCPRLLDNNEDKINEYAKRAKKNMKIARQKGEWIDYTEDGYVECPFCHSATNCDGNKDKLHFCFSCGADMRGEQNDS